MNLIKMLSWKNNLHLAKMYTVLLSQISSDINAYVKNLVTAFRKDLNDNGAIKPATCVKLNNVEYLKTSLDALQNSINADDLTQLLDEQEMNKKSESNQRPPKYIYTIEVIQAENLKAMDLNGYSDPYVELLNANTQQVLFRTRTIYKELNPIWNEQFEFVTDQSERITLRVWDEDRNGRDLCGGCTFVLNPAEFADNRAKDEWYDLKFAGDESTGHGQIKVIISMERQRDNLLFHLGTAFKELRVAEDFMVSHLTSKFQNSISTYVSHSALKKLLKTEGTFNRLMGRSAPSVSDEEIEIAIQPLFELITPDFYVFGHTLTESMKMRVFISAWTKMLQAIEALVIPPLSERQTRQKLLTDDELRVLTIWIQEACEFFHGDGRGPPLEELKSSEHYKTIEIARAYYSLPAAELARNYERLSVATFDSMRKHDTIGVTKLLGRSRTVMAHRNLSTMNAEQRKLGDAVAAEASETIILRILRVKDASLLRKFFEKRKQRIDIINGQAIAKAAPERAGGRAKQAFNRRSHVPQYPSMPPLPN